MTLHRSQLVLFGTAEQAGRLLSDSCPAWVVRALSDANGSARPCQLTVLLEERELTLLHGRVEHGGCICSSRQVESGDHLGAALLTLPRVIGREHLL